MSPPDPRFVVLFAVATVATMTPVVARQTTGPITYHVTFPEAEHHWMQVEVTWTGLGSAPLQARMSRSSPGRYAVHEFAKNVFSVEAFNGKGQRAARYTRPNVDEWDVAGHDGTVRIVYKIFGDYADGTYLGVDTTHAHMNMPATFMWATGTRTRRCASRSRRRPDRTGRSARSCFRPPIRGRSPRRTCSTSWTARRSSPTSS